MDILTAIFVRHFGPCEYLNYDQLMTKYFGSNPRRQFVKGKPIRFGYKAWCVSSENSYLRNFQIHLTYKFG